MKTQELNLQDSASQSIRLENSVEVGLDEIDMSTMLVKDLPFTILILDRELNIVLANSYAKTMIHQATNLRHLMFFESGQHERLKTDQLPVGKVFETGERLSLRNIEFEAPGYGRAPLYFWAKPFETGIDDQVEKIVVVILGDFEVNLSGELRQAKLEAEAAVRAKNHFLSNISHELRTPLNGVMGLLQLVVKGENLLPEQIRNLNMALDTSIRLQTLLDAVLELSSIEAGGLVLKQQPYNLRELIVDIDSTYSPQAELKGVEVEIRVIDQHHELVGDHKKVRLIITALVENAVKFTESGSIRLEVSTTDVSLNIKVADTGRGISEEQQRQLFEAFHQQLNYQSVAGQAMGLGLKICQSYVKLMGGHLSFESVVGQGSVFHVDIPISTVSGSALLGSAPVIGLVMEDEEYYGDSLEDNAESMTMVLSRLDTSVRQSLVNAVLSADPLAFSQILGASGMETKWAIELDDMMVRFQYDAILKQLSS